MWNFVMDKSGTGAGLLRELRFPLPIYIPSAIQKLEKLFSAHSTNFSFQKHVTFTTTAGTDKEKLLPKINGASNKQVS
jgi:hypothetical protein